MTRSQRRLQILVSLHGAGLALVVAGLCSERFAFAFLLLPLLAGQPVLLAVWAVFGGPATPWRFLAGLTAGVAILGGIPSAVESVCGNVTDTFEAFLATTCFVAIFSFSSLLLFSVRLIGWDLRLVSKRHEASPQPRFQLALSSMLAWVCAVAILLGTASFYFRELRSEPAQEFFPGLRAALTWFAMIESAIITAVTVPVVFFVFTKRLRIVAGLLLFLGPPLFLASVALAETWDPGAFVAPACGAATCAAYSLFPLRHDLRLTWRWRAGGSSPPACEGEPAVEEESA